MEGLKEGEEPDQKKEGGIGGIEYRDLKRERGMEDRGRFAGDPRVPAELSSPSSPLPSPSSSSSSTSRRRRFRDALAAPEVTCLDTCLEGSLGNKIGEIQLGV